MSRLVLGIDPGFASCGVAVVELRPQGEIIRSIDVLRTQKSDKKQKVLASDDNFRRARRLSSMLMALFERNPSICAIAVESMSFPRSASNAAKMAMCWGVIASISVDRGLAVVQASPKEIKKALCGKATASKVEVQTQINKRYSGSADVIAEFESEYPTSQHEHGFDALGAIVACLDSDVIRMARGISR